MSLMEELCEISITVTAGERIATLKDKAKGCGDTCIQNETCMAKVGQVVIQRRSVWQRLGPKISAEAELDSLMEETGFLMQTDGAADETDDEETQVSSTTNMAATNNNVEDIKQFARAGLKQEHGKEVLKSIVESGIKPECGLTIKKEMLEEADEDVAPMLQINDYNMQAELDIKDEPLDEPRPGASGIQNEENASSELLPSNTEDGLRHYSNLFAESHRAIGMYPCWNQLSKGVYSQPDVHFRAVFNPELCLKWTIEISCRVSYNRHNNIVGMFVAVDHDRNLRVDPDGMMAIIHKNVVTGGRPIGHTAGEGLSKKELETFSHDTYTSCRWLLHPSQGGKLELHCTLLKRMGSGADQWGVMVLNPDCRSCHQFETPRRPIPYNTRLRFSDSDGSYYLDEMSDDEISSIDYSPINGTFTLHSSRDSFHTANSSLLGANDSLSMPPVDLNDPKSFTSEEGREAIKTAMATPPPGGLPNTRAPPPTPEQGRKPDPRKPESTPIRRRQPMRRVRLEQYLRERGLIPRERRSTV